jgi:hypothetical protein
MSLRKAGFHAHQEEVWKRIAEEFGGDFIKKGTWQTEKVRVQVDQWTVTLDIRTVPGFKSEQHFTRLRAPFVNPEGVRFEIYGKDLLADIYELFGMQDIETGFPEIDESYVVQATDPDKIRRLLANEKIRRLIREQPDFHLRLAAAEEDYPEQLAEGVDELQFQVPELIEDHDRLYALYQLFAEMLHTLTHLGSAYEDDPRMDV